MPDTAPAPAPKRRGPGRPRKSETPPPPSDETTPPTPPAEVVDGAALDPRPTPPRAARAASRRAARETPPEAPAAALPPRGPGRPSAMDKRAREVVAVVGGVGLMLSQFPDPLGADGAVLVEGAPRLGMAVSKVAERNPKVAKVLDGTLDASGWIELGAALAAIAFPIARNHLAAGRPPAPDVVDQGAAPASLDDVVVDPVTSPVAFTVGGGVRLPRSA